MSIFDNISNLVNRAALDTINEISVELVAALQREIPVNSGKAKASIRIIPAKYKGNVIVGGVSIGNNEVDYIKAIIQGINEDYNNPYYHFPAERWPDGPPELLGKDGWYHFAHVHHQTDPNDFVTRAKDSYDVQNAFKNKFLKKLNLDFKIEIK